MNETQEQVSWMPTAREQKRQSPSGKVIKIEGVTHTGENLVGYNGGTLISL